MTEYDSKCALAKKTGLKTVLFISADITRKKITDSGYSG
jgi:hypothetical protein